MQQEGFVVGVETFVGAVIERLRAIRRLIGGIPIPIDGN